MDAILVRGQPYQTIEYRGLAPVVSTVHAVLTIDGAAAPPGTAVTGTRFVLELNSGVTWTVRLETEYNECKARRCDALRARIVSRRHMDGVLSGRTRAES